MMILARVYRYICRHLWYIFRRSKYANLSKSAIIVDEKMLTPRYISVAEKVVIWHNCRIEGVKRYNSITYQPLIELKKGVKIQQNCHITCCNSIVIDSNTCISAGVTITDINHPYLNIDIPVEMQDLEVSSVYIGSDSKIYNGAVVLPGVNIGKHCVIGANSVVTKDIPDYCVAVGAPAIIVKRYNFSSKQWEKTDKLGNFL